MAQGERDNRTSKEKVIDDWLPITSSRKAKWWYSTFHNVTAMVGAGVLSLPYAMSELGWGPGLTILILSWIITLYTLWQMVEMHEMVPGKRFDRYHELGQHAFGEKLGLWIVVPQQLTVEVGVCIVYMVTGGKSLKKFHDVLCPDCKSIRTTYFIMIFGSVHFVLSQLPNFNSISVVSLAAAVMSLSYSIIAWVASVEKGRQPDVDYGYRSSTRTGTVFSFLSALGDVAFAYAGHNVVLEIQATIPSTPEMPSKKPMWKGVVFAYIVVAICYFPVALIGYWAFGNAVDDNILITLEKPRWLIALANMMVVVHVIGSYQIYAMPVFDMLETVLVKKLHFPPGLTLRLIARSIFVAFTMFVGIAIPFFGGLLGFFGGFVFAPTTYWLPCIMWLLVCKPKKFSLSWFINWICIILGIMLTIMAPIGALRSLILSASTYKFFSDSIFSVEQLMRRMSYLLPSIVYIMLLMKLLIFFKGVCNEAGNNITWGLALLANKFWEDKISKVDSTSGSNLNLVRIGKRSASDIASWLGVTPQNILVQAFPAFDQAFYSRLPAVEHEFQSDLSLSGS